MKDIGCKYGEREEKERERELLYICLIVENYVWKCFIGDYKKVLKVFGRKLYYYFKIDCYLVF